MDGRKGALIVKTVQLQQPLLATVFLAMKARWLRSMSCLLRCGLCTLVDTHTHTHARTYTHTAVRRAGGSPPSRGATGRQM